MAPAEIEFKNAWAVGLAPEERKTVLSAGQQKIFTPHDYSELTVYCVASDNGANVTIRDKSLRFEGNNLENPKNNSPVKTVTITNDSVSIKDLSNEEVATIKHIPKDEST